MFVRFPLAGMRPRAPACEVWEVGFRCLIVDDNAGFLTAARGLLERQGVTVVGAASTGAEALRLVGELRPDVVLLDINLGGESGFRVARHIAEGADHGTPRVRMILISSHADEEEYADLLAESPAVGFLAKSALSAGAVRELLERPQVEE
jgi:CheY-like chemotaxis protein